MRKLNIVLINSSGISHEYGIGSYINQLRSGLIKHKNLNVINVDVTFEEVGNISVTKKNDTELKININNKFEGEDTTSSISKTVFYLILLNSKINNGIFHINGHWDLGLGRVAKENGFKVILTQHVNFIDNEIFRSLITIIDGCIFLNEGTRKRFIKEFQFPFDRTTLILNGISWKFKTSSKRILKKKYGFQNKDFIFLFVGRIDPTKGIYELVEAFKLFSKDSTNKKLIIVGKGNYNEVFKISKSQLNNILFTGHINKQVLSEIYKIADVGVLPSYSEQSSFAVIEMIHNNLPLILSDIEGFEVYQKDEVIKTKISLKDDEKRVDIDYLKNNLDLVYNDPNIRKKLVKNTEKYKLKVNNLEYMTTKIINFYFEMFSVNTN